MEEFENIYDKIKELIGDYPNRLSVLEEQIDIDLQMKYFDVSKKVKEDIDENFILHNSDKLFNRSYAIEDKRDLLSKLASIEKVEAYRTIEKFMENPPDELRSWGILALQESKMLLESKILNENKVFISTGLGGKGDKLRYFVVLIGKSKNEFSELQKKIIRTEFEMTLKNYNSKIEEINFSQSYATLLTIVPMNITIKQIFKEAIDESNQYGDFLNPNFIITNVKKLSFKEIGDFVEKQQMLTKTSK